MNDAHTSIWDMALPYQGARGDADHAYITLEYARQLIDLQAGDPNVIIPAIILHDTGWSMLSQSEKMLIFRSGVTHEEKLHIRLRHQEEGVKIARRILETLDYPTVWTEEIIEIISEHDTRAGFISHNEGLVRDSDKLWRFSKSGFDADVRRYDISPQSQIKKLVGLINLENFFYSSTSVELANRDLDRRNEEFMQVCHHQENLEINLHENTTLY